jgi:hypothetical protein
MKIIIVHDKEGTSAALHIKRYVIEKKEWSAIEPVEVILMDGKQWSQSRLTEAGEISNFALFIGRNKDVKELRDMMDIAQIKFSKYGVIYSISKPYAVLTANPKELKKSKSDYTVFLKELQKLVPNRIDNATHGKNRALSFLKGGIKKMLYENRSLHRQQLLYGAAVFCRKELSSFLGVDSDG